MRRIFIRYLFLITVFYYSSMFSFQIMEQSEATEKLGYGDWNIALDGELLLMRQFLKDGDVVFDVGANVGEWSTFALKTCPTIRLRMFEPVPLVYKQLKELLSSYKNTEVFNLAFSDTDGNSNFFFYYDPPQDSGLSGFYYREVLKGDHKEPQVIQVQQKTLDAFCTERAITRINFLKIDTEGAEWRILSSAQSLLKNHQICAIQFEYGGCYIDAKTTLEQIMRLLTKYKYAIFRIIPEGLIHISQWRSSLENFTLSNYFAICCEDLPSYSLVNFE